MAPESPVPNPIKKSKIKLTTPFLSKHYSRIIVFEIEMLQMITLDPSDFGLI